MTRTPARWPLLIVVVVGLAASVSCRGGCRRGKGADVAAVVKGRLALFPIAARVVVAVEVARLRASPAAGKLSTLVTEAQADKDTLAAFQRRTGLDPVKQISSITLAFPDEARAGGEFGMILRGDLFDETRLVAYARDQLQKNGDDLVATKHGRFTLWSSRRDPAVVGFFVDNQTFVLGGGSWGPRMAELADTARPGDSAATNLDSSTWSSAPRRRAPSGARRWFPRKPAARSPPIPSSGKRPASPRSPAASIWTRGWRPSSRPTSPPQRARSHWPAR
jgi:hypothetical protein